MVRAIGRIAGIAGCAVLATLALGGAGGAQTPRPSPTPAPTPIAFSAHAHANVTVVTTGGTFGGSLRLGLAQRPNLTRIDVLGVTSDTLPIPPIGVTAVIDHSARTITIWNDVTKQYRVQPFSINLVRPAPRPSASPNASASPRPSPPPRRVTSPLAHLDVLALTIKLTGHTMTSGLPTTGLSLDFQAQGRGSANMAHVAATTQLADDFPFFPMTLDASVDPGSPGTNAKIAYAVDDLTRATPPLDRFTRPAGYTEARPIADVIFQRRPSMPSSPLPMTSPPTAASPSPR